MPLIAIIDGIKIHMHHKVDEHPPPHIHARYSGCDAEFEIDSGELLKGKFPKL